MSGAVAAIALGSIFAAEATIPAALFSQPRGFYGAQSVIIPGIVVEEDHEDTLTITRHPIEMGAAVTDHAYKESPTVSIRCGWSDSNLAAFLAGAEPSYILSVYQALLNMQNSRMPVEIVTGKRAYANMLLKNLRLHTDEATENVLDVTIDAQHIIIVNTATGTITPQSAQAQPQSTSPTLNNGPVQPTAATVQSSILGQVLGSTNFNP